MNKECLQFAFDHKSQLKYLEIALATLPKANYENFDLVLAINESLSKDDEYISFKEKYKNIFPIKEVLINEKTTGMFFWLLSPFYLEEYDKIIQLDNDLIFSPRLNFKNLIEDASVFDETYFNGYKVDATKSKYAKYRIMKILNTDDQDVMIGNYINSGVVVINAKKYRENETQSKIFDSINSFFNTCEKLNLPKTDQEFLFLNFKDKLGFIPKNWNLRFFEKTEIAQHLLEDDAIYHYCVRVLNFRNWKMQKPDYPYFLNSKCSSKKYCRKHLRWVWFSNPSYWFPFKSFTRNGRMLRKYRKNIKSFYKEIFENYMLFKK